MASIGIQVLFGFLLALPFSSRFPALDRPQRLLYLTVLVLTALAMAQLGAPVAFHRFVFRRHKRAQLLRFANIMSLTGMATVGVSVCGAVLLVTSLALRGVAGPVVVALTASVFASLWLVVPLRVRGRKVPAGRAKWTTERGGMVTAFRREQAHADGDSDN